jgi:hypothetical protein
MPDPLTVLHIQAVAGRILEAIQRREMRDGEATLADMIVKHGPYLSVAFAAWCDTAVNAIATLGLDAGPSTELIRSVCRMESGQGEDRQWAVRIFKARADDDRSTYLTCLMELNGCDGETRWNRIVALMATAATVVEACALVGGRTR